MQSFEMHIDKEINNIKWINIYALLILSYFLLFIRYIYIFTGTQDKDSDS